MKKLLSVMLCLALSATIVTGCDSAGKPDATSDTSASVTEETTKETTEETTEESATETTEEAPDFEFQPKVCSHFYEDIYGTAMCEAWFSLVDAVMAGEDTFSCPNGHTYLWVLSDFPNACFPVLGEIVKQPDNYDFTQVNGTARFEYKVPKEEAAQMIAEFEELVVDILNETMREEYSDFEKALSLYSYFTHNYTYDYDTYRLIEDNQIVNYTSAYRLLTTGNGICSEIAPAYSYLLMQVGVEASVVTGGKHEWSIVKLDDKYYHVDPTFGLDNWDYLGYFMMTDEQRSEEGDYSPAEFEYVGSYSPEVDPVYTADDESFAVLWDYHYESFDYKNDELECWKYSDEEGDQVSFTFDYSECPQ